VSDAWAELTAAEYDDVWPRFERQFGHPGGQTALHEPYPSIVYHLDLASVWWAESDAAGLAIWHTNEALESDCYGKMLHAFQQCLTDGESLYVLDWQHTCYRFWPHRLPSDAPRSEWVVPLLPDGDCYHFLSKDFQFGLLGYAYGMSGNKNDEPAWCVFGEKLVDAVKADLPIVVNRIVRDTFTTQDGK